MAGQHAAVPVGKAPFYDANYYNEEREFGLPELLLKGHEELSALHPAGGHRPRLRPGVQQRAARRPLHHVPDLHGAATERPADRADLHQHLRAAAAAAGALRPARPDDPRADRRLAERPARRGRSAPGTCRWSWAGHGSSARTGPTRSSTPRRSSGSPTATSTGCLAKVTLDSLHAPGNATHGFMDFMLMMGIAEREQGRLRRQPGPVPHHGGVLHLVPERGGRMSKYLVNKFLYIDRPRTRARRALPGAIPRAPSPGGRPRRPTWILNCLRGERIDLAAAFTDDERRGAGTHDHAACSRWARIRSSP